MFCHVKSDAKTALHSELNGYSDDQLHGPGDLVSAHICTNGANGALLMQRGSS